MKKLMFAALAAMSVFGFAGCDQESGKTTETKTEVKSPDGGKTKTTEKTETKTETSGADKTTSPAI